MRKLLSISVLCLGIAVFQGAAQSLPELPKATEITTGMLSNGMSYYIVTNAATPGFADYALIQPFYPSNHIDRKSMTALPHFTGRKPHEFLSENGIGYNPYGYAYFAGEAANAAGEKGRSLIYRFSEVPVFNQAVADSTLLLLFDLALTSEFSQTIVISGDVNSSAIADRMGLLAMMIPVRKTLELTETHEFVRSTEIVANLSVVHGAVFSSVEAFYKAPRTERKQRNTMLPRMTELMALQLGDIIHNRLENYLSENDVPNAGIDITYAGVGKSDEDEGLKIKVNTTSGYLDKACACLSTVLSDIDMNGVRMEEMLSTGAKRRTLTRRDAGNVAVTNAEYVNKCIASCLYGTDLAPATIVRDFFKDKELDREKQAEIFNRFATAVLDREKNLILNFTVPEEPAGGVDPFVQTFRDSWGTNINTFRSHIQADTLALRVPKKKTKIKSSDSDPLTGGEIWTFGNDVRVIFKQNREITGKFFYTFAIKGGFLGIPDLKKGEKPFINDMLPLFKVSGMSGSTFAGMLASNGIEMKGEINESDFRLSGCATSDRFSLLMKSLLSFSSEREPDENALESYILGERLRIRMRSRSTEGLCETLDSIMSPKYKYLDKRLIENISTSLPKRIGTYLDHQFDNCGSAILVIVGDLDKENVQKQLCRFVAELHPGSQRAVRPKSTFELNKKWLTRFIPSKISITSGRSINVAMCAKLPFNIDNYFAHQIAAIAVEREITKEMGNLGMTAEVKAKGYRDRMSLYVVCRPCNPDGLPADVEPGRSTDVLNAIRKSVNRFSVRTVSEDELKTFKNILINRTSAQATDPAHIVNSVVMRNFEGIDVLSNYKTKISSVALPSVNSILTSLVDGAKVECVIQ